MAALMSEAPGLPPDSSLPALTNVAGAAVQEMKPQDSSSSSILVECSDAKSKTLTSDSSSFEEEDPLVDQIFAAGQNSGYRRQSCCHGKGSVCVIN